LLGLRSCRDSLRCAPGCCLILGLTFSCRYSRNKPVV
jgi:hypothetical protein